MNERLRNAFLTLNRSDLELIGSPRWSESGDALEYPDGQTFVFPMEIRLFIDGFGSVARLPRPREILWLMAFLGLGRTPPGVSLALLARLVRSENHPTRNAGALCAELLRRAGSESINENSVHKQWNEFIYKKNCSEYNDKISSGYSIEGCLDSTHRMSRAPIFENYAQLREEIEAAANELGDDAIRHWLRHGSAPVDQTGEELAQIVELPRLAGLTEAIEQIARHERLRESWFLARSIEAAVSLPPRKSEAAVLPVGGHADVANRGGFDRLLLSQLVLDDDELIRRLAENELLFHKREEPVRPRVQKLIVFLDQGMRVWGHPRLVLTAAAFALGRLAERKQLAFELAPSSAQGKCFNPLTTHAEQLGESLQTVTFEESPLGVLSQTLETLDDLETRELVVLTHPRSLSDPGMDQLHHQAPPGTRINYLTVDDQGAAAWSEQRSHGVVTSRRFSLRAAHVRDQLTSHSRPSMPWRWTGPVEPFNYPFSLDHLGWLGTHRLDFDASGHWFASVSHRGVVRVWSTEEPTFSQTLPRAQVQGSMDVEVLAFFGTRQGFALAGRWGRALAVVDYDFHDGACRVHLISFSPARGVGWTYDLDEHVVIAEISGLLVAIDLETGKLHREFLHDAKRATLQRLDPAARACGKVRGQLLHPRELLVQSWDLDESRQRSALLHTETGTLILDLEGGTPIQMTPPNQNQPLLKDFHLRRACYNGGVLALAASKSIKTRYIFVFRMPGCVPMGAYTMHSENPQLMVDPTGRHLLNLGPSQELQLHDLKLGTMIFTVDGLPPEPIVAVSASRGQIRIQTQKFLYGFEFSGEQVEVEVVPMVFGSQAGIDQPTTLSTSAPTELQGGHDPTRSLCAVGDGPRCVADLYNHLRIFGPDSELVATFFVTRATWGIHLPDGSSWGSLSRSRLLNHPAKSQELARTLRELWGARRAH